MCMDRTKAYVIHHPQAFGCKHERGDRGRPAPETARIGSVFEAAHFERERLHMREPAYVGGLQPRQQGWMNPDETGARAAAQPLHAAAKHDVRAKLRD